MIDYVMMVEQLIFNELYIEFSSKPTGHLICRLVLKTNLTKTKMTKTRPRPPVMNTLERPLLAIFLTLHSIHLMEPPEISPMG
jgi:hypothetical protein